jgi:hypothetical protein
MTTDELERDLAELAGPRDGDEDLRRATRSTLRDQLQARPARRRRRRLALPTAAVAATALAAGVLAVLGTGRFGGPSSADAAILAHVTGAMNPPANIIVHVSETGTLPDGTRVAAEWWQGTDPPYAKRVIKGPVGDLHEGASDGTTSSLYDAGTNTIYQQPEAGPSTLVDPVESVRAELADGTAHVAGTVTIDGQSLYKIELSNDLVGYFDQTDYRPVYLDNGQRDGTVVRTRVTTYEELPLTSASQELLSITAQHPGAKVESGPPPDSPGTGSGQTKQR